MAIGYNIKATNMDLTDELHDHVINKFSALEKLIDPDDTSAHADIEVGKTTKHHKTGRIFRAEINLHIAGSNLRAVAKEEDLMAAIDRVQDEIMRRLRKEKTKRTDFVRRSARQFKKMIQRFSPRDNE